MIRKLLLAAAALALPLGFVVATSTTAYAKGKPPPDPAVTCTVSATVTFASPGISKAGSITTAKDSTTSTSNESFGGAGCSGSGPSLAISSKNVKCDKKTAGEPSSNTACEPGFRGYDSWANFESSGASTLQKAVKKLSFTINGIPYSTKTTSVSEPSCGSGQVGFEVNGTVKGPKNDKGQTATLLACLGGTTGTGTSAGCQANFAQCLVDQQGTVQTAKIDPTASTLKIS